MTDLKTALPGTLMAMRATGKTNAKELHEKFVAISLLRTWQKRLFWRRIHVSDALWFTYLPVFRSVARHSLVGRVTHPGSVDYSYWAPLQAPQHGDLRQASTSRNPGPMTVRLWGGMCGPNWAGTERRCRLLCRHHHVSPSTDWRSVMSVGSGEADSKSYSVSRASPRMRGREGPVFYQRQSARTICMDGALWFAKPTVRFQPRFDCSHVPLVPVHVFFSNVFSFLVSLYLGLMGYKQRDSTLRQAPTKPSRAYLRIPTRPQYPTTRSKDSSPPSETL